MGIDNKTARSIFTKIPLSNFRICINNDSDRSLNYSDLNP